MIVQLLAETEIIDDIPEALNAYVVAFDERLIASLPEQKQAAMEWLNSRFPTFKARFGNRFEQAVVVWSDAEGTHVGIDTRFLPSAAALAVDKLRQHTAWRLQPSHIAKIRTFYRDTARARQIQLDDAPLHYRPAVWLVDHIESFQDAVAQRLEEILERFDQAIIF
jgi:hypothetical protein